MFGAPPWILSKLMSDKTEPAAERIFTLARIRPEVFSWRQKTKVSVRMEEKQNKRFSTLSIICALCIFFMQGVPVQSLECYYCSDLGDGSCLENTIKKNLCSPDENMCVETVTAIESSHEQFTVLVKGCGSGMPTRTEKASYFHGITVYTLVVQCNSSLCNKEFETKNFQLPPPDNTSNWVNEVQCYNCIGKGNGQCTPSTAPVKQCFNSLNNCFDGNVTIKLGNSTAAVPVKSCSQEDHCAVQTFAFGAPTVEIKGACCRGNLCNQDLSNKTQYMELPPLVLIPPPVVDLNHTSAIPPVSAMPTHEQPQPTRTSNAPNDVNVTVNSNTTISSALSNQNGNDQPSKASPLQISPWLVCSALLLFKL
uniref:UPAR/Ly6 domain-containing protein n=1 Tax=Leptobrachium leishanense TaxID=445787 RepID=A0A8C5R8U2_9ANUR